MLARHAEDLFWIGRYLERAEDTARLLDVTYHGSLESSVEDPTRRWRELARRCCTSSSVRAHAASSARDGPVSEFLVLDDDERRLDRVVDRARARQRPHRPRAHLDRALGGDQHASTSSCAPATSAPTCNGSRTSCTAS